MNPALYAQIDADIVSGILGLKVVNPASVQSQLYPDNTGLPDGEAISVCGPGPVTRSGLDSGAWQQTAEWWIWLMDNLGDQPAAVEHAKKGAYLTIIKTIMDHFGSETKATGKTSLPTALEVVKCVIGAEQIFVTQMDKARHVKAGFSLRFLAYEARV